MTISDASSKGFSLFTPLVGTAIVVIAILIANGMIQNDARISKSLVASYEISSQSTVAKLIKATAEVQILSNIETAIYDILTNDAEFAVTCDSESACISEMTDVFTEPNHALKTRMTTGAHGLYGGVIGSVNMVTAYSTSVSDQDLSDCLKKIADAKESAVIVTFDNGHLNVTINSAELKSTCPEVLIIPFEDDKGNKMAVSIIPDEFSYVTKEPIKEWIDESASAFAAMADSDLGSVGDDRKGCYIDGDNKAARITWNLDNGKEFKITLSNGFCPIL